MKFERVRSGEYRAQVKDGVFIWVLREDRHWVWFLCGYDTKLGVWETDNVGPFASRKEAIKDAVDNYENFLD